jgi:uncharacterized protein (DUF305 family)
MSGGTKVFIGASGAALLLLMLFSAFAAGTVWSPRDVQGAGRGPNSGMGPGTGPHPMMGGSSAASSFEEDEPFDRQFIDHMIPHHAMAIRSAQHMISDSERQELRELADDIVESQSEQIGRMRAWREEWYGDPGPAYAYPGDGLSDGIGWDDGGMMGRDGMMDSAAADAMFLRMMIPHHEQAIEMSREALDKADHPEIRQLAEQIIAEQSAEIELMRGCLREID